MVLVDTSVWIIHLRNGSRHLEQLLFDGEVACHPFVVGELACANLKNRNEILNLLQSLPIVPTIDFNEFLFFIKQNSLMGIGIGFVDVHLLASAQLASISLWTSDRKLKEATVDLELAYK